MGNPQSEYADAAEARRPNPLGSAFEDLAPVERGARRRQTGDGGLVAPPGVPLVLAEAFPYDTAPRHLIRDRDAIFGEAFQRRVRGMGIEQVLTAPRSPWQNPYVERLIGSIRRDCLNHVIVLNERHLVRILRSYQSYYNETRPHLSLLKDSPAGRTVQPPEAGAKIIAFPEVGGLHHRYERIAA